MKESGDRGKMCFCETDYCNGAPSPIGPWNVLTLMVLGSGLLISTGLVSSGSSSKPINLMKLRCHI
jgi:hypothetical protein